MLRRLRDAWNQYWATLPRTEWVDSIPESQWDDPNLRPKVSQAMRAAFAELLECLHAHLPGDRARAVAQDRAGFLARGDEADAALARALTEYASDGERWATSAAIACDWKAADELAWQVDRLARAQGWADRWTAPRRGLEADLAHLGDWLGERGLCLCRFSCGDNLIAVALPAAQAGRVKRLFRRLRIPVRVGGGVEG